MTKISIYLTNLAAYVRGELRGKWVELPFDEDDLPETLKSIGVGRYNEGFDEEFFITDYETEISGLTIGEYVNIQELNNFAEEIEDLDEERLEVLSAYLENAGSPNEWKRALDDVQSGNWRYYSGADDMSDVASIVLEEMYSDVLENLPDIIRDNLDYESMGNWLETSGTYVATAHGYVEMY